ncbi:dihydrofolate reductase [Rhizobium sp. RU20A]|uniref:dihydrofolate reductase n=1 Tax=Rhizobium sp. RU20A TaxID=1907412 RepID=UPI0009560998|nr:dihydrofolate reductase [Rhizobium sp. RU20A]SIQ19620.1 dihydrofolate reductase [Rhizobium sp. RU20A]
MAEAKLALVVAVAENGVIGRDGDLPWRLPSDLKRFKALTMGKPVVMGRRTYQSIGRPLPGRPNIVVTRDASFAAEGVAVVGSVAEAIALGRREAERLGVGEVSIIGGGEIYRQTIDAADVIHVTEVGAVIAGDTRFPDIDPERFVRSFEEVLPQGEKDSHPMRFVSYLRRS